MSDKPAKDFGNAARRNISSISSALGGSSCVTTTTAKADKRTSVSTGMGLREQEQVRRFSC